MKTLVLALIAVACFNPIQGCASKPTAAEIAEFDYGPMPGDREEAEIKAFFEDALKDPESARYKWGDWNRFWVQEAPLMGGDRHVGWLMIVGVNAKNSFGGYTGSKDYGFIYKNGKLQKLVTPEEWGLLRR
jgi:hypothetical protein